MISSTNTAEPAIRTPGTRSSCVMPRRAAHCVHTVTVPASTTEASRSSSPAACSSSRSDARPGTPEPGRVAREPQAHVDPCCHGCRRDREGLVGQLGGRDAGGRLHDQTSGRGGCRFAHAVRVSVRRMVAMSVHVLEMFFLGLLVAATVTITLVRGLRGLQALQGPALDVSFAHPRRARARGLPAGVVGGFLAR